MSKTINSSLLESLQKYFGFSKFKGDQERIIKNILAGNNTFVIMPTGGGKSLCYQLPAFMMDGVALVVSPLIALMKNQVDAVRAKHEDDGVAHYLNSSLTKTQIRQVREDINSGKTKLVYIAPETLTKAENIEFFSKLSISFLAIDEAHCISEWGHDFRPEYRRIKTMIEKLGQEFPLVALTATATEKVQSDILKNLGVERANLFISSFNRENLYYEIRPKLDKDEVLKDIVHYISNKKGASGIIYTQSRKSTEELAEVLKINGINAKPYHAGLDQKTRAKTQDAFLMEDLDVICATIAFGMGIDKPDVRFVIHYDMPKSLENYYQETGRAGRDGMGGDCIAYFSYRDMDRMEKFLKDKNVAERQLGLELIHEVTSYAETGNCRRQTILNYFGEEFDKAKCKDKCDNCAQPKKYQDITIELAQILAACDETGENYGKKQLIEFIRGEDLPWITEFEFDKKKHYAKGKKGDLRLWNSVLSFAVLNGFVAKQIELYGVLKLTKKGKSFMKNPKTIKAPLNNEFVKSAALNKPKAEAVLDEALFGILKELRKKVAKDKEVPPFVVFQDPSLHDMCIYYPCTTDELTKIAGVNKGKAMRYGKLFIECIAKYVEENSIVRPQEMVVKSIANKSKVKVDIIQQIDLKKPLADIASNVKMSFAELLTEIETIVDSGTKVNLKYHTTEAIDEYTREDIYEYFMEANTDSTVLAFEALKEDDITHEEIKLMRIQFMCEMGG